MKRRFQIRLTLDNDAFAVDERQEVANVLAQIARDMVMSEDDEQKAVFDVNGNNIGFWGFSGEKTT